MERINITERLHKIFMYHFGEVSALLSKLKASLIYIKRHTRNLKRKNRNKKRCIKINIDMKYIMNKNNCIPKL